MGPPNMIRRIKIAAISDLENLMEGISAKRWIGTVKKLLSGTRRLTTRYVSFWEIVNWSGAKLVPPSKPVGAWKLEGRVTRI